MKRTSVMLPEDSLGRVVREAERRGISVAAVVRAAVEEHLPPSEPGTPLAFFAVGEGEPGGSERVDDYVGGAVVEGLEDPIDR